MDNAQAPLVIIPVPALKDNYVWLIRRGRAAVVVDPGDAEPVEAALAQHDLSLDAILLTHHHLDHMGGVDALVSVRSAARPAARLPIYGPASETIDCVTQPLHDGDRVTLASLGIAFDVLSVPGHTRGHIAYFCAAPGTSTDKAASFAAPLLFCGDTLFACGCGRLFEGTAAQMHASLTRHAALPGATRVYCAHEYTLANIRFARVVEPANAALAVRETEAIATRARGEPTLPSTIQIERATNPFLRGEVGAVRQAAASMERGADTNSVDTFAALRKWKDVF